jgi:DeoR family fructose operon transcriptional repressor
VYSPAGVSGLRAEPGLTDYNADDARVKKSAIRAARRTVVLADRTKLGRVSLRHHRSAE